MIDFVSVRTIKGRSINMGFFSKCHVGKKNLMLTWDFFWLSVSDSLSIVSFNFRFFVSGITDTHTDIDSKLSPVTLAYLSLGYAPWSEGGIGPVPVSVSGLVLGLANSRSSRSKKGRRSIVRRPQASHLTVVLSKSALSGPSVCLRARVPCPLRVYCPGADRAERAAQLRALALPCLGADRAKVQALALPVAPWVKTPPSSSAAAALLRCCTCVPSPYSFALPVPI
jgi:hypothetical protein